MTDEQAAELIKQNELLRAENARLREELQLQKDLVGELLKRIYGSSSEKLSTDQLLLKFMEDGAKKFAAAETSEPAAETQTEKKPRKKSTRKQRLKDSMAQLPTITKEIVPEEVLQNPDLYRQIGEERSERLEVSPSSFTRHVTLRPTFVKKADYDNAPTTAPLPLSLLPGSVLTPSLGAWLLTEKFCYQRLEWRLKHAHGIGLSRSMMCHWHNHLADILLPLYDIIATDIRLSSYVKVDEWSGATWTTVGSPQGTSGGEDQTPLRYLDPGKGTTSTGQLWTYHHSKHGVLFDWHTSRANDCLDRILIGKKDDTPFSGHLQSDGLRAYQTFIERQDKLRGVKNTIIPVSCLAHIRRKFVKAENDHPKITAWILYQIGKIYKTEADCRKQNAPPDRRLLMRIGNSKSTYDHLSKLFNHLQRRRSITPQSNLGKALKYAREQWPHLQPCFKHGVIEFDNNLTENAIRPTKLGHKNWMFIGGADTGWRSAVVYTFIEQIRTHGADPFAYLCWVFDKLTTATNQDDLRQLLPKAWLMNQRALAQTSQAA